MTYYLLYCPDCGHCRPRVGSGNMVLVSCDHPVDEMVRLDVEVVGRHEHVKMWRPPKWPIRFWLRPDGNGGRWVEHKPGKAKNPRLYSVEQFAERLARRSPVLLAAFRARGDVRRGAGA